MSEQFPDNVSREPPRMMDGSGWITMNETDEQVLMDRLFPQHGAWLDRIGQHDIEPSESYGTTVTLRQILVLRNKQLRWQCVMPRCNECFSFRADQVWYVPFWIVRHFLAAHGMSGDAILRIEPSWMEEVRDGIEVLRRRTPVNEQTGVPAIKENAEVNNMTNNKPTRKLECGAISVAIWSNQIETANGPKMIEKLTVERRYKDKDGQWKSTGGFTANDLPKLVLLLQKAYEHMVLTSRDDNDEDQSNGSE